MSIFDRKERKRKDQIQQGINEYFKEFTAYTPAFKDFNGGLWEMELTRAAIHFKANQRAKAEPNVLGSGNEFIERVLQNQPNSLMDTKKYMYRLSVMTDTCNNAFIAPIYDDMRQKIIGFYPIHPSKCQLKSVDGTVWLVYQFKPGIFSAIEFSKCGHLNQHQNKDEIFGDSNTPLLPTLQLMDAQNQAINEAVRNSSNIRFLAKLGQALRQEDVEKERDRFVKSNFSNNDSGVMLIDSKYSEVKQLQSNQFTIDEKQMRLIRENVFDYFGVSENLLQSKYTSEEFNSFYESQIEPWLNEMSLVHSKMLFNDRERAFGNKVVFSSNRLFCLPVSEKITLIQTLFDRGLLTPNEAREILNMTEVENGDSFYIRKEYTEQTTEEPAKEEPQEEPETINEEVNEDDTNEQTEV